MRKETKFHQEWEKEWKKANAERRSLFYCTNCETSFILEESILSKFPKQNKLEYLNNIVKCCKYPFILYAVSSFHPHKSPKIIPFKRILTPIQYLTWKITGVLE